MTLTVEIAVIFSYTNKESVSLIYFIYEQDEFCRQSVTINNIISK